MGENENEDDAEFGIITKTLPSGEQLIGFRSKGEPLSEVDFHTKKDVRKAFKKAVNQLTYEEYERFWASLERAEKEE